MSNWTRYNSRGNVCPVCNGERRKRDCRSRENSEGIRFYHCRANSLNPSFKYIKDDGLGFGMYIEAAIDEANQEKFREEWLEQKRRRDAENAKREKERLSITLNQQERDTNNRKLQSQLTFKNHHFRKLLDRGLTEEQIISHGYLSTSGCDRLKQKVDKYTPGTNGYGSKMACCPGILIPIYNHKSQLLGFQIKAEDGGYRWASNDARPVKLPNGEIPLAFFDSNNQDGTVYLTESTGFKPHITNIRFNRPTIGASGANFYGGKQQLRTYLEHCQATEIRLMPDGGMLGNKNILGQYLKVTHILEKWGYKILFGWWNQIEKKDSNGRGTDIDEISDRALASIQYLTPTEFFSKQSLVEYKVPEPPKDRLLTLREKPFHRTNAINFKDSLVLDRVEDLRVNFKANERLKMISHCYYQEVKAVVDTSLMGSGKSHFVSEISLDDFYGADRIVYVSQNYLNPTVKAIATNYKPLMPRHHGMVRNEKGNLKRSEAHHGLGDIDSNCLNTQYFFNAFNSGMSSEDASTVICGGCPFITSCGKERGRFYGYKNERKQALASSMIRADINALPLASEFDYSKAVLVVDEISSMVLTKKESISKTLAFGEDYQELKELTGDRTNRKFLKDLENLLTKPVSRYGEILNIELNLPKETNEIFNLLDAKYDEVMEKSSHQINGKTKVILFLKKLISVVAKLEQGTVINNNNSLEIEYVNQHHLDILRSSKYVVGLDATPNWKELNYVFENQVLEIREEQPPLSNLTIEEIYIPGLNHKASLTSPKHRLKDRVEAVKSVLLEKYPKAPVIGFKANGDDSYWFKDNRGSNEFIGAETMIAIGMPKVNVTAAEASYLTLHGTKEGFAEAYEISTYTEVIQVIGRQRAQNSPDKKFKLIFLTGGNSNLDALARLYGANYSYQNGIDLTSLAGTKRQQNQLKILGAAIELQTKGEKITQKAIASLSGIKEKTLSEGDYFKKSSFCFLDSIKALSGFFDKPQSNVYCDWFSGDRNNRLNYSTFISQLKNTPKPQSNLYYDWLLVPSALAPQDLRSLPVYYSENVPTTPELKARCELLIKRFTQLGYGFFIEDTEAWAKGSGYVQTEGSIYRSGYLNIINHLENLLIDIEDRCLYCDTIEQENKSNFASINLDNPNSSRSEDRGGLNHDPKHNRSLQAISKNSRNETKVVRSEIERIWQTIYVSSKTTRIKQALQKKLVIDSKTAILMIAAITKTTVNVNSLLHPENEPKLQWMLRYFRENLDSIERDFLNSQKAIAK